MCDVQWIKLSTDIFSNRKIKQLQYIPNGDTIFFVWIRLLVLAADTNDCGQIYMVKDKPYSRSQLAAVIERSVDVVGESIKTFIDFDMISIDDGIITIKNWEKYQNVSGMEKVREQARMRMRDYRERKKLGITSVGSNCVYCGKPANTVDHIIPKSKGGQDTDWNLVPSCKSCNSSKKDKSLAEFLNDSFYYDYQGIDHALVRSNSKLMALVKFDEKTGRYTDVQHNNDVTVTSRYGTDKDIDKEKDIDIPKEKNKKKRDKKKKTIEDVLNERNLSDALGKAVHDFIDMRADINKPMSGTALELMLNKLDGMASDEKTKIDILNQSIINGWQGIFDIERGRGNGKKVYQQKMTKNDEEALDFVFGRASS